MFDAGVNCGAPRARAWLSTVAAHGSEADQIRAFSALNLAFHKRLKTWLRYGHVWDGRIARCEAQALKLLAAAPQSVTPRVAAPSTASVRPAPRAADQALAHPVITWFAATLFGPVQHLPFHHGVPGGRWLTLLMNRISPTLFAQVFTDWVRATWPGRPDLVAIDGKTSRRSHDRTTGTPPLHLVSAFATTSRLVLGQEAVPDKANETRAIPVLIERLAADDGLKGALVSIGAIATNAAIATTILDAGADYLPAVKANQPTLRAEAEALFAAAPPGTLDTHADVDKGHGRIEERSVSVAREVDWLNGGRRFPGETRLPGAACLVRVSSRTHIKDRCRFDTRSYVSSAPLTAARAAEAVRGHWGIENKLHWVLDVVFADDQSRLRKGHGAHTMAVVRHFAVNLVRSAPDPARPKPMKPQRRPKPGSIPRPMTLKLRRKMAGGKPDYLANVIGADADQGC